MYTLVGVKAGELVRTSQSQGGVYWKEKKFYEKTTPEYNEDRTAVPNV